MKRTPSDLNDEIAAQIARKEKYLEDIIRNARTEIAALRVVNDHIPEIAALQDLTYGPDNAAQSGAQVVESIAFYGSKCNIYVYPPGLASAACPELLDLLDYIEGISGELKSLDYPDAGYRYYYNNSFSVYAYPREDGLCKRVITGVERKTVNKLVEVEIDEPIYAFKC